MLEQRGVRIAGYVAFGFVSFFLCLYLSFPADVVGQRLVHEVRTRSGGKVGLSFSELSLYGLSGVEAENVRLEWAEQKGRDKTTVTFPEARLRLRLLPLLMLTLAVDVGVELGGGSLEATLEPGSGREWALDLEIEEVDLNQEPQVARAAGIPVKGVVSGVMHVTWPGAAPQADGEGTFLIEGAQLGPGTLGGMSINEVSLGTLEIALELAKGRLDVTSFAQQGGDIEFEPKGGISSLRSPLAASTLDVCLRFKPTAEFLRKDPKVKSVVEIAQAMLPKDPEGFMNVPLSGRLTSPQRRNGTCKGPRRQRRGRP